jgi:uncharacterized protein YyaL (SSP411 family)
MRRRRHPNNPREGLAASLRDVASDLAAFFEEHRMALSPRAQAIVDRINALAQNVNTNVAAEEAAHDAANAAANDADDTGIEGALTTLEGAVGAPPAGDPAPIPPADPAS